MLLSKTYFLDESVLFVNVVLLVKEVPFIETDSLVNTVLLIRLIPVVLFVRLIPIVRFVSALVLLI